MQSWLLIMRSVGTDIDVRSRKAMGRHLFSSFSSLLRMYFWLYHKIALLYSRKGRMAAFRLLRDESVDGP